MKKNNKIGLLVALMLLGTYNFSSRSMTVQAKTDGFIITVEEQQPQIKANKDTFEKAKSLMAEKDFQAAIDYLTAYINGKPKKYEAYKLRGECYYAMRQYELARDDFQTAVDIKTSDDKFITGTKIVGAVVLGADKSEQYQNTELGNLYGELMYAQKALNDPNYEETYKKAFEYNSHIYLPQPKKDEIAKINCPQKYGKELNPVGIDVDIKNIVEDIERNDYHEAAYKVQKITSEYPDYYYGYYLTGVVMSGLEQEKDAVSSFEKSISLNPDDFESMASLGQLYYSDAEKHLSANYAIKSIGYFEKALSYNPNCYIYHFYIGLNNLLLSRNDIAISEFDKAIVLKSNDYNSMYYKLIAQYLKSDYSEVVDGATKLLNKHVSNSNSVLYLRALANYKLEHNDEALADIEKAFSSMNDIYNADIKRTSKKEQTLPAYLYLLKAQILKSKGEDNSQELAKAYENPIIKTMAKSIMAEINISPVDFENQLDYIRTAFIDKKIMMKYLGNEYKVSNIGTKDNKIEQESSDVLSEEPSSLALALAKGDITDSDASKEEVSSSQITMRQAKLPEENLSDDAKPSIAQMLATQTVGQVSSKAVETIAPVAKNDENIKDTEFVISYDEDVKLPEKNENSNSDNKKEVEIVQNSDLKVEKPQGEIASTKTVLSAPVQKDTKDFSIKYDEPTPVIAFNNESEEVEIIEVSENKPEINPFEVMDEPVVKTENKQEVLPVLSTSPSVPAQNKVVYVPTSETSAQESVKSVAKEIKETPDFKISYDEPALPILREPDKTVEDVKQEVLAEVENNINTASAKTNDVERDIAQLVESHLGGNAPTIESALNDMGNNINQAEVIAKEQKQVVEKYANVDLSEFNVEKPVLHISESDEIVVFEPSNFIAKAEEKLAQDDFGIKDSTKQITDNFAQIQKQAKEYVESLTEVNNEIVSENLQKVDVPKLSASDVEKTAQEIKEPELIIPKAVVSEKSEEKIIKDTENVATKTVEKVQTVVPTVRADKYSLTGEEPKEITASQKISDAQEVLAEVENKQRSKTENVIAETIDTNKEQALWDFLSEESLPELPVQKADAKDKTLTEFLNDDFDKEAVEKAKAKKIRKLNKRTKKEAQVASIVQNTLAGDTIQSDVFSTTAEQKTKKSLFKRKKKVKDSIEKTVSDTTNIADKKSKSLKNLFSKKKDVIDTKSQINNENNKFKNWFKKEKKIKEVAEKYDTTIADAPKKAKKQINWFWKKNKSDVEKVSKFKTEKVKKQKVETDKKRFSLKNIFRRNKVEQ